MGAEFVSFEEAKSGRSTCRATGEPIGKGEWRCGFDCFISGRIAKAWMKPLPFLQSCCRVEYAASAGGSQGSCKVTGQKFQRGDVRVVLTAGDPSKKAYLCLEAAGRELAPVLEHVGPAAFKPTSLAGLPELAAEDRAAVWAALAVGTKEVAAFERRHPAPQRPTFDKPSPAAKKKASKKAAAVAAEEEEEQAGEEMEEQGQPADAGGVSDDAAEAAASRPAKRARAAKPAAAAAAAADDDAQEEQGQEEQAGLSALELQRAELIRRNRERLESLGLPGLASEMLPEPKKAAKGAAHKGVSRKRLSEVLPRRESSRIRGLAADGSQVLSERQGEVTVVNGEVIRRYGAGGSMEEEQEPQERHPQGELVFGSTNASHSTDEAFIQLLAHASASADAGGGGGGGGTGGGPLRAAAAAKLRLAEEDVAKVTKDAVTHLAFHPTTDTLVVACADKKGNMGLWHVNEGSYQLPAAAQRRAPILPAAAEARDDGEGGEAATGEAAQLSPEGGSEGGEGGGGDGGGGAFDGVLALRSQHYEYMCGLKFAGGSGRGSSLFTASYDGSLRRLDLQRGVSEVVVSSEDGEYSAMDVSADGRTALLGDKDGQLQVVDVRAPAGSSGLGPPLPLHAKKLNTVHLEPGQEQVFVTASTDTTVRLWDLRALSSSRGGKAPQPVATAQHAKGSQGAFFAPDGSRRVVSTSFDDTVRTWDGASGLAPLLRIKHDNNTGRWVLPFRAVWTSAGDGVVIGNMRRYADVFSASTGALAAQLSSDLMTAIPSRNAAHPALPVLASATNSGRVHIFRT